MKNLLKIDGVKALTKNNQKRLNGGASGCPSGCYAPYFASGTGKCAIPNPSGSGACYGVERNGLCCI